MMAKALVHEPQLLFLDEPTAGVDVSLRHQMWKNIYDLKQKGVTIILTTHYLDEAEKISDRIGIIKKGSLTVIDSTQNILSQFNKKVITFVLEKPITVIPPALQDTHTYLNEDRTALSCHIDPQKLSLHQIINIFEQQKNTVKDIFTQENSLENIFLELTETP